MSTPIYDRLKEYRAKNRISFAMPGHKNARMLAEGLSDLDVTELPETLDLRSGSDETVRAATRRLSKLYCSDESFILTGGSTLGIQAMLCSVLRPGGVLLTGSDCHMSVINACAVCGFNVRFIPADIDEETLIPFDYCDIEKLLDKYDDVAAVLVTSPNYYGICRDIGRYAEACHKRNIPLLVDEAHGAHFIASAKLPKTALRCGADLVVNSAHKTLNALTGAAYLHVRSSLVDKRRLKDALNIFSSSSPSYPIAASADIAREELEDGEAWSSLCDYCAAFRHRLENELFVKVIKNNDPTRIVISFITYNVSGYDVSKTLGDRYGIDIEMADAMNIVLIATPSNTKSDFDALFRALSAITDDLEVRREKCAMLPPAAHDRFIRPQKALYADRTTVNITDSIGRLSARTITAYPPGIPVLCAGEEITTGLTLYLRHLKKAGAIFTGFDGIKIEVISK